MLINALTNVNKRELIVVLQFFIFLGGEIWSNIYLRN